MARSISAAVAALVALRATSAAALGDLDFSRVHFIAAAGANL